MSAGYFDLQVNGYGGVDFNSDDLTAEMLHRACEKLQADGVGGILATIITEKIDLMLARLRKLVELREHDELAKKIIAGIHIEGPFINETTGYRGAHPADAVIPASVDNAQRLHDACGGLLQTADALARARSRFRDDPLARRAWRDRLGRSLRMRRSKN